MFTIKNSGTSNTTYKVKGDTLADIWASIQAKGPTVDGKRVAGVTDSKIEILKSSVKMDQTFNPDKKGGFDAELFHKKGTLTYKCNIHMPKLASNRTLSKNAKAEWTRFMGKLATHEEGHVTVTGKEAKVMGAEIDAMKFKGSGADKRTAFDNAVKAYKKEFPAKYSEAKVKDRIKKVHKAFHSSGGHGPTLNTSIL